MPRIAAGIVERLPVVSATEPDYFDVEIPKRRGHSNNKGLGDLAARIDAMPVNDKRCLFIPLPPIDEPKQHYNRVSGAITSALKRDRTKTFKRRTMKMGAVEGVGVWRTA